MKSLCNAVHFQKKYFSLLISSLLKGTFPLKENSFGLKLPEVYFYMFLRVNSDNERRPQEYVRL